MEVKIEYEGKEGLVKLRKLKWGENNDCVRKATKFTNGTQELDMVTLHELRLLKSIESAPFPIKIETLRNLPHSDGDLLFNKMQEINATTEEQKKSSDQPSSPTDLVETN